MKNLGRIFKTIIIGMVIGFLLTLVLAAFKVELGTWLGLLVIAASFAGGWFIAPKIKI